MNIIPAHTSKDRKILDLIKKENLRNRLLHAADENILFDAKNSVKRIGISILSLSVQTEIS